MIKLEDVKEEIVAIAQDLIDELFSAHQQIINYYNHHTFFISYMPSGNHRGSYWMFEVYNSHFYRIFKLIESLKEAFRGNILCEVFVIDHAKSMLEMVMIEIKAICFRTLEEHRFRPFIEGLCEKFLEAMGDQEKNLEALKDLILQITPETPPEIYQIGAYHA